MESIYWLVLSLTGYDMRPNQAPQDLVKFVSSNPYVQEGVDTLIPVNGTKVKVNGNLSYLQLVRSNIALDSLKAQYQPIFENCEATVYGLSEKEGNGLVESDGSKFEPWVNRHIAIPGNYYSKYKGMNLQIINPKSNANTFAKVTDISFLPTFCVDVQPLVAQDLQFKNIQPTGVGDRVMVQVQVDQLEVNSAQTLINLSQELKKRKDAKLIIPKP